MSQLRRNSGSSPAEPLVFALSERTQPGMPQDNDDYPPKPQGEPLARGIVGWWLHEREYVVEFESDLELQVKFSPFGSVFRWVSSSGSGASLWERAGDG